MIKQKILLVDDESTNIAILVEILGLDYTLLVTTCGASALEILNSQDDIDLVLLDIVMPLMDGYEIANEIKNNTSLQHIPFIFLTSKNNPQSVLKGFNVGAVDYIAKPFIKEELLARVKTHLNIKNISDNLEKKVIELDRAIKHYETLNLALPVGVLVYNANTKAITFVNAAAEAILQMSEEEIIKNGLATKKWQAINEEGVVLSLSSNPAIITIKTKKPVREVIVGLKFDDFTTWLDLNSEAILDKDGFVKEVILTMSDITKQKNIENELESEQKRFSLAIEGSQDGLWDFNLLTNEAYTSTQYQKILGYEDGELPKVYSELSKLIHPDDKEPMLRIIRDYFSEKGDGIYENRFRMLKKNGEYVWILGRGKADFSSDGKPLRFVGFNTDITNQVNHEIELDHSAKHDSLTGLPNRFLLSELLNQMMRQADRNGEQIALVFIDLDGFKEINDNYGHEAGDFVLKEIAFRIKDAIRDNDLAARIGGDEFVAVLMQVKDCEKLIQLLNRILCDISTPIHYGLEKLKVSASMGISFYPQGDDIGGEVLLRQADQAMYDAKMGGKNKYTFFDKVVNEEMYKQQEKLRLISSTGFGSDISTNYN